MWNVSGAVCSCTEMVVGEIKTIHRQPSLHSAHSSSSSVHPHLQKEPKVGGELEKLVIKN